MENIQVKTLSIRDIRYTQDSISDSFSDNKPLEETYRRLLYGELPVSDLPKIEVVFDEGVWWVIEGNRRLFLLKRLENVKGPDEVEVIVKDLRDPKVMAMYQKKKTTKCEGKYIVCRGGELKEKLRQIDSEYMQLYDSEQNRKLIEQCSVESFGADDYVEHYEVPDFFPGISRRKCKYDV